MICKGAIVAKAQLTIFAVRNADTILIEAKGKRILTDLNHCVSAEDDDDILDIAEPLREACSDARLHLFVLTHPDQDHLRNFTEIFHLGSPGEHNPNPKSGVAKILVEEIWCSPYAINGAYETETSKPVLKEIKRRNALAGTAEGGKDGNRLCVMDTAGSTSGSLVDGISWELLGPTPEEADIPKPKEGEAPPSSNGSSLIIRWAVTVDDNVNNVLLGGDAPVEVWERVWAENEETPGRLAWHVLVAPHHTSRHCLGWKDANDKFHFSDAAVAALSEQHGSGWIVSSSRAVVDDDDDPPSHCAKQKYLEILAAGGKVDDGVKSRFVCTDEYDDGKPGHIVFQFTRNGPAKGRGGPKTSSTVVTAATRGGGYGKRRW